MAPLTLWTLAALPYAGANEPAVFAAEEFGKANKTLTQSGSEIRLEALSGRDALYERVSDFHPQDRLRLVGRSVGQLDLLIRRRGTGATITEVCTATLVAPNRVLTNHHCIPGEGTVLAAELHLGYLTREGGSDKYRVEVEPIESDPDLDYAIVAVNGVPEDRYPPISLRVGQPQDGQSLYVWHHPIGSPQRLTRYGCRSKAPWRDRATQHLVHTCDTEPGSSGALLLDQDFNVVALHHRGIRDEDEIYNFGTPMQVLMARSATLKGLETQAPDVPNEQTQPGFQGPSRRYTAVRAREACQTEAREAGAQEWAQRLSKQIRERRAVVEQEWAKVASQFDACPELVDLASREACKADLASFIEWTAPYAVARVPGDTWTVTTQEGVRCEVSIDPISQRIDLPAVIRATELRGILDRALPVPLPTPRPSPDRISPPQPRTIPVTQRAVDKPKCNRRRREAGMYIGGAFAVLGASAAGATWLTGGDDGLQADEQAVMAATGAASAAGLGLLIGNVIWKKDCR